MQPLAILTKDFDYVVEARPYRSRNYIPIGEGCYKLKNNKESLRDLMLAVDSAVLAYGGRRVRIGVRSDRMCGWNYDKTSAVDIIAECLIDESKIIKV